MGRLARFSTTLRIVLAAALVASSAGRSIAQPTAAGLVVPAGTHVEDVVVLHGPVDVYGIVDGDAILASGDLVVHPGGRIAGDAISAFGKVQVLPGASVAGSVRSGAGGTVAPAKDAVAPVKAPVADTWHGIKLVLGWLTILLVIGAGVLVTASPYLDGVAEAFEGSFGRALGVGILGQMLALPALLVLIVALALTVVGILGIPLAVVAYVIACAGLLTLGFLAVAFVTGRSILGGERGPKRRRATSARGEAVAALAVGISVYLALWLASAALTTVPAIAVVLRTVALAVTWVAATAGFGATLISRAGTRSEAARAAAGSSGGARGPQPSAVPGWQTPTPVHGVVAARRPSGSGTSASTPSGRD